MPDQIEQMVQALSGAHPLEAARQRQQMEGSQENPAASFVLDSYLPHILGNVKGALSLPGDVYAGRVNPESPEGISRTMGLAGMMVGTPGGPLGALGSGFRGYGPGTMNKASKFKSHMESGGAPDDFAGNVTTATRRWARDKGMGIEQEYVREAGNTASRKEGRFSAGDDSALLAYKDKGFSAAEIGEKMGITRNAVIGRLSRLKQKSETGEATSAPVKREPSLPSVKFLERPLLPED